MGVVEALPLLARFSSDTRDNVQRELVMAWPRFDAEAYAQQVLSNVKISALEVHDPTMVPSVRHLRHVTDLSCSVPPLGTLDFVPPQVSTLHLQVSGRVDLSTLDTPALRDLTVVGGRFVDVFPLMALKHLTSLTIRTAGVRNLSALADHRELREVALLAGCTIADLASFGSKWSLSTLTLANVADLRDLLPLALLESPRELHLERCPRLRSLEGVPLLWATSLEKLALRHCALADLTPLTRLLNLTDLDLYGSPVSDLSPLTQLPHLERLTVSSCRTVRDLAPVTRMRHLNTLRITHGGPVNLGGLAGIRDLVVKIEGVTQVSGEGALGPGSQVERVTDLRAGAGR